jgi:hypothetical protein
MIRKGAPGLAGRALLHPLSLVSPSQAVSALRVTIPREKLWNASPGAVGPARRLRRRYAHAPAAALASEFSGADLWMTGDWCRQN